MTNDDDITIRDAQQMVDNWIRTVGVRYFSELTNMACSRRRSANWRAVISRTYGDQSFKPGESHDLGEEMVGVLWVLICLANQTGVDLTDALRQSLDKKNSRDAMRHKQNPKLSHTQP